MAGEPNRLVAATPDATRAKRAAASSARASPSTVDRWLGRLSLTLEKRRAGRPVPAPRPGQVVRMDDPSSHKMAGVREAIGPARPGSVAMQINCKGPLGSVWRIPRSPEIDASGG